MRTSKTLDQRRVLSTSRCSLCGNNTPIFDEEKCEMICNNCGMVISDGWELAYDTQSFETLVAIDKSGSRSRDRTNAPLLMHDMGLSTSISNSTTDANGGTIDPAHRMVLSRLRRLNRHTGSNRSRQRSMISAFTYINNMKQKLSLTDAIAERAAYNYRKALSLNLIKGRSIDAMVVAATYAACREFGAAKSIDEIAQTIGAKPSFSKRCFRLIMQKMRINAPKMDANRYLNRAANTLKVQGRAYRNALNILNIVTSHHIAQGKNPKALAAASLYLASNNEKPPQISLCMVANACDISVVAIRKRITEIRQQNLVA